MKNTDAAIKVRTKQAASVNVNAEANKLAVSTMVIAAGFVGAWVVAAFVGGIMASGGLMPLVSNWIQAIVG